MFTINAQFLSKQLSCCPVRDYSENDADDRNENKCDMKLPMLNYIMIEPEPTVCNKDTGLKQRMQKWSRGHLFIVRGGGIIDKWSPLFRYS